MSTAWTVQARVIDASRKTWYAEQDRGLRDEVHLREVLSMLYQECLDTRYISCDPIGTERFSRETQAKQMADIVRVVSGNDQA